MTGRTSSALAGVVFAGSLVALWIPDTLPAGDNAPPGMCVPGYARSHRLWDTDRAQYWRLHDQAFAAYGVPLSEEHAYRLDDMVPLCLGGRQTAENLWPQPIAESFAKDRLEWRACEDVCAGRVPYSEALSWFTRDGWRDAYRRVFGDNP